jgi:dCMP deaminase
MNYLIAYVPVLHEGYRTLFLKYQGATLYLAGPDEVKAALPRLSRDLRQMPLDSMCAAVRGLGIFAEVAPLTGEVIDRLNRERASIVMPVDEVSTVLAEQLTMCSVSYESVFLRWDKPITLAEQEVHPDRTITTDAFDRMCMHQATDESQKSADWWRQVGAVAVQDGAVVYAGFNAHHPSEYAVFAVGNPRDNFDAGEQLEISDTIHGEASIVAQAARKMLLGTSVYVTTFPCINCARLLAEVYYRDGYSRLDAEYVLKERGVEVIRVV